MGCYPSVPSSSRRGASSSYSGRADHGYRRGSDPYTRGEYSRRAGHRHERNARPIHYDMDLDGYSGGGYGRSSARDRGERLRIWEAAGAGSMAICRVMLESSITKELAGRALGGGCTSGMCTVGQGSVVASLLETPEGKHVQDSFVDGKLQSALSYMTYRSRRCPS